MVTGMEKSKYNTNFLNTIQEFANLEKGKNLNRSKSG